MLSRPGWARGRDALLALLAVLVVVLLVIVFNSGGGDDPAPGNARSQKNSAASTLSATISSYDPSGGSGFRSSGNGWTTQRYSSPTFGNLKPGVGLVLDLGAKRAVSAVTFTAADGPLTVELRAGDASGGSQNYARVAQTSSASGATTLQGQAGGEHRYWMLWVTRLGTGNSATIRNIAVTGSA